MNSRHKRNRNQQISINRNQELIHTVLVRGKPIMYAAKKLRLKYSKARNIVNKYREIHHNSTVSPPQRLSTVINQHSDSAKEELSLQQSEARQQNPNEAPPQQGWIMDYDYWVSCYNANLNWLFCQQVGWNPFW